KSRPPRILRSEMARFPPSIFVGPDRKRRSSPPAPSCRSASCASISVRGSSTLGQWHRVEAHGGEIFRKVSARDHRRWLCFSRFSQRWLDGYLSVEQRPL